MNTTTNTRVSEAMPARINKAPFYWEVGGGVKLDAATGYCNGWNDCLAALEAALSAEPAAQGECERIADLSANLTSALKLVDHQRKQIEALTAPPAQPAERVPEGAWTDDAKNWGVALNDAAWTFINSCPEKSALLFNTCKTALRAAILTYAEKVAAR